MRYSKDSSLKTRKGIRNDKSHHFVYRKYTTKRNWNDDETKLLNWAIATYSEKRGIRGDAFTSIDWQNIAKLVPGRNDAQC